MKIIIPTTASKDEAFDILEKMLSDKNIRIESRDNTRPWGGFFKIEESDTQRFIDEFFHDVPVSSVRKTEKLSPKILLVEKEKRLSWQYHHRRSEIWKVIYGTVQVMISDDDNQTQPEKKHVNDVIILDKGQRHRLIGDDGWGVIAEIWQHADHLNPSNEEDIVRVQDDFGR